MWWLAAVVAVASPGPTAVEVEAAVVGPLVSVRTVRTVAGARGPWTLSLGREVVAVEVERSDGTVLRSEVRHPEAPGGALGPRSLGGTVRIPADAVAIRTEAVGLAAWRDGRWEVGGLVPPDADGVPVRVTVTADVGGPPRDVAAWAGAAIAVDDRGFVARDDGAGPGWAVRWSTGGEALSVRAWRAGRVAVVLFEPPAGGRRFAREVAVIVDPAVARDERAWSGAVDAVSEVLGTLDARDRVAVLGAIDPATRVATGFVTATPGAVGAVRRALARRIFRSVGTADLFAAAAALPGDVRARRTIVWIGDRAPLDADRVVEVVGDLDLPVVAVPVSGPSAWSARLEAAGAIPVGPGTLAEAVRAPIAVDVDVTGRIAPARVPDLRDRPVVVFAVGGPTVGVSWRGVEGEVHRAIGAREIGDRALEVALAHLRAASVPHRRFADGPSIHEVLLAPLPLQAPRPRQRGPGGPGLPRWRPEVGILSVDRATETFVTLFQPRDPGPAVLPLPGFEGRPQRAAGRGGPVYALGGRFAHDGGWGEIGGEVAGALVREGVWARGTFEGVRSDRGTAVSGDRVAAEIDVEAAAGVAVRGRAGVEAVEVVGPVEVDGRRGRVGADLVARVGRGGAIRVGAEGVGTLVGGGDRREDVRALGTIGASFRQGRVEVGGRAVGGAGWTDRRGRALGAATLEIGAEPGRWRWGASVAASGIGPAVTGGGAFSGAVRPGARSRWTLGAGVARIPADVRAVPDLTSPRVPAEDTAVVAVRREIGSRWSLDVSGGWRRVAVWRGEGVVGLASGGGIVAASGVHGEAAIRGAFGERGRIGVGVRGARVRAEADPADPFVLGLPRFLDDLRPLRVDGWVSWETPWTAVGQTVRVEAGWGAPVRRFGPGRRHLAFRVGHAVDARLGRITIAVEGRLGTPASLVSTRGGVVLPWGWVAVERRDEGVVRVAVAVGR